LEFFFELKIVQLLLSVAVAFGLFLSLGSVNRFEFFFTLEVDPLAARELRRLKSKEFLLAAQFKFGI
jgi:hypothetical protein